MIFRHFLNIFMNHKFLKTFALKKWSNAALKHKISFFFGNKGKREGRGDLEKRVHLITLARDPQIVEHAPGTATDRHAVNIKNPKKAPLGSLLNLNIKCQPNSSIWSKYRGRTNSKIKIKKQRENPLHHNYGRGRGGATGMKSQYPEKTHLGPLLNALSKFQFSISIW